MIDLPTRVAGWIGGLLLVAAAFGGTYLTGRLHGRDAERAVWTERQIVAERAARQTETDLAALAAKSAARQAQKEALLNDQANRQTAAWRAAMARVRDIRVPAAVGVQLNAAAGVPAAPSVAGTPGAGPDAGDLDPLIGLAETLDACRQNNLAGRTNADRLTEARDWYEALRARVNRQ
ncbi:MAG: hypothetical protein KJZ57_02740 [Anaerolineales bacterium]|nr:hypothetical protein [Anaerolineales bacterium]